MPQTNTEAGKSQSTHPYASFIGEVQRPGRYLGEEFGTAEKEWDATDGHMAFAFPDIYEVAMSHMGTKILYKVVNDQQDLLLDRVMMPWIDMEEKLREEKVHLVSLEHRKPLCDFDVVGFSLQFELTYTNVLAMLELGGIPIESNERGIDMPLVIAGGPTATHPEALAPFIDGFFIGEGEEELPGLLRSWVELKKSGKSRLECLRSLAENFALYVPQLYEVEVDEKSGFQVVKNQREEGGAPYPVQRAMVEDLNKFPFPVDSPEPVAEAVFDRAGIEVARGCTEGCRFCQAGMIYRPVRERSPESILQTLRGSIEVSGHDEISLTSLSTADYSAIVPLVNKVSEELGDDRISLSVSSLRAYGLPEETLNAIRSVRASGLTFAPEAGSQRMRDVINKNISEEDMLNTARRVFDKGWQRMKLYFMMGLPTETYEDLGAIVQMGRKVHRMGRERYGRRANLTVSVSVHVPKPHTPFQWCAMDTLEQVDEKQRFLRFEAKKARLTVKTHASDGALIEGVLARGDRRVANAVRAAYYKGCRFDGWDELFKFDSWLEAFKENDVDIELYTNTIPVDGRLPWDHIDVGLAEGFLAQEYKRSMKGRYSPPCSKPFGGAENLDRKLDKEHRTSGGHHTNIEDHDRDERRLICYDCGVACDLDLMRDERRDYLFQLDAQKRVAHSASTSQAEQAPQRGAPAPPKRAFQGASARIRFRYHRTSPAHLVGHIDTARKFPRILRRANIKPAYSEGFNPKPRITYGPTLPLGTESVCEVMDIHLLEKDMGPLDTLCDRMNAVSPKGFYFESAELIPESEKNLSKSIEERSTIVRMVLLGTPDKEEQERIKELIESQVAMASTATSLPLTVVRKKGEVERDATDNLRSIKLVAPDRIEHSFAPSGTCIAAVEISQSMSPQPTVRPEELVRSLLGDDAKGIWLESLRIELKLKPIKTPALHTPQVAV